MPKLTVFSCDPGTENFACSIVEIEYNKTRIKKIKIIGTCMLKDTLQDLTKNVDQSLAVFRKRIRKISKQAKTLDAVCFERFQSRGLKGKTIEAIGFMLGQLAYIFKKLDPTFILASTWKNRINAINDMKLDDVYKKYALKRVITDKTEHELDAVLIGIYRAHKVLGLTDFEYFKTNDFHEFVEDFLKAPNLTY
tara:strand:- start:1865 stop:2446 length:582 start_codon:yes stop_codon:yes gene_type:complete